MDFTRGLDPKEAMKVGLSATHECLPHLKELLPELSFEEIDEITERFNSAEGYWNTNLGKIKNTERCIKYLLICESPPANGNYFYKCTKDYLFKQVWKCFFGNKPICPNSNDAYQCLADVGFLLIDSLPFPVKYNSKQRRKAAYKKMIECYLPVWINKLNSNFKFCTDLRITFGFKLNGLAVIGSSPNGIDLSGVNRALNKAMIAATGAGQPSSNLLAKKFGIAWGSYKCTKC